MGVLLLAAFASGSGGNLASAQSEILPTSNVRVADGQNPGEVIISWDYVEQTTYYRIRYVNMERDYPLAKASRTGNWMEAFVYVDLEARNFVVSRGRVQYTMRGLQQGVRHAFSVLTHGSRYDEPAWPSNPRWLFLTVADWGGTCPTATPVPTPQPPPKPPQPTLTPLPPAANGDYDTDNDGLIEVSNLAQLNAIRADLGGDGSSQSEIYTDAFPAAQTGMGCPKLGCVGYELVADLDFDTNGNGVADAGDAYWNDGEGWFAIGDSPDGFSAIFDGDGHTISNWRGGFGLFGYLDESAVIRNVGLISVSLTSPYYSGTLAAKSFGVISNSYIVRTTSSSPNGGLIDANRGVIDSSYVVGAPITGHRWVGALASDNSGTISNSYATVNVNGRGPFIGGLVAANHGTIIASYATGNVDGGDIYGGGPYVGGLAGQNENDGMIIASYATGSVNGASESGGLIGRNEGTIVASYATGSVTGTGDDIGGLVGRSYGNGLIIASYATGRVSGSGLTTYVGGLIGDNSGTVADSYWDTQTSGQAGSYGGIGQSTGELQSPTGYSGIYANWNIDIDGDGVVDDPWDFGAPDQYPVLKYAGLSVAAQR